MEWERGTLEDAALLFLGNIFRNKQGGDLEGLGEKERKANLRRFFCP